MTNNLSILLSKPWQKFLIKLNSIDDVKVSDWKDVHLLGYICQRFTKIHSVNYALSYKGQPGKCPEMYLVKKMMAMLGTANSKIVKEYIDWVYDVKIVPKQIKFRSLGFFTTPSFGNEFLLIQQEKNKIHKSTNLPPEYKQVADTLQLPVVTYGDLAFVKMALDQSPNSDSRAPYRTLFNTLKVLGFESSVLINLV